VKGLIDLRIEEEKYIEKKILNVRIRNKVKD